MATAASRVLCVRAVSTMAAAPCVNSTRSRMCVSAAPVLSFHGRPVRQISSRQRSTFRSGQVVQVRAQSTAEKVEKMATEADIITKIKHDHRELQEQFDNYKKAQRHGQDDEARKWFNQFVWEISRHSVSEELVLYPILDTLGEKGQQLADKSREDHHKTKEALADLQKTHDPEEFDRKMDEMMAELNQHIKMEEEEDLVLLEKEVESGKRETAGATFALGKNLVPTHPHPSVPEKPVALEAAAGLLAKPIDMLRDVFTPKNTLN